jgi:hypothetical protein
VMTYNSALIEIKNPAKTEQDLNAWVIFI